MRKRVVTPTIINPEQKGPEEWLDLDTHASVEVTSEDPAFPIESAFAGGEGPGWRAASHGMQVIRLILDKPRSIRRIRLAFIETAYARTQEFTLRWAGAGGPMTEIVRQQWTFSPQGATSEIEDYQVTLDDVVILELTLRPDLTPAAALASLASWRIA